MRLAGADLGKASRRRRRRRREKDMPIYWTCMLARPPRAFKVHDTYSIPCREVSSFSEMFVPSATTYFPGKPNEFSRRHNGGNVAETAIRVKQRRWHGERRRHRRCRRRPKRRRRAGGRAQGVFKRFNMIWDLQTVCNNAANSVSLDPAGAYPKCG